MSKPQFDLSNLGGQPKDWLQHDFERSLEPGLGIKTWGLILVTGGCILLALLGALDLLLRILS
jgi:hypothetical protein